MRRSARNPGFVLLMVLVLVLIAGTILSATARHCCDRAFEAGREERDLQLRWGERSCREFFAPSAELLLKEEAARRAGPASMVTRSLDLGGLRFRVTVGDEQAKANVNLLASRLSREVLEARLQLLQSATSAYGTRISLKPDKSPQQTSPRRETLRSRFRSRRTRLREARQKAETVESRYVSLDQVLVVNHPSELFEKETGRPVVDRITCWGDGRLNFKRADEESLRQVLSGVVGETELLQLTDYRMSHPDCTLSEALRQLGVKREQVEALRKALTETSSCHSIWIVAEGRTRKWYSLYVEQDAASPGSGEETWRFEW